MIESEFRDWTRGQLRALDERLKAVAREARAPRPREPLDGVIQGDIASMLAQMTERQKLGQVAALAIAFIDDEGLAKTGWSLNTGYFALAGAATFMGLEILEGFRKTETETANDQPADHASQDPAPQAG